MQRNAVTKIKEALSNGHNTNATPELAKPLTPQRKKRVPRGRAGYLDHAADMFDLYARHSAELGTSIDVTSARHDAAQVTALAKAEEDAQLAFQAASDARLLAEARVWKAELEIYGKASADDTLKNHETLVAFADLLRNGPHPAIEQPTTAAHPAAPLMKTTTTMTTETAPPSKNP